MASAQTVLLPSVISTPSDVRRLRRELEELDEFMHQAGLRQGGKAVKLPVTSRLLDELASIEKSNLIHKTDRDRLIKYLSLLIEKAPVLHMSFASEPSAAFMAKLVTWLRQNIHPQVLVRIGLQPSVAAGCVLRTANKEYDFSLRQSLLNKKDILIAELRKDPSA